MEYTCLINFFTENENVYKEHNGIMHLYVEGTPSGVNWIFRKDGTWGRVEKVDGKWKSNALGKWRCDGDSNFIVENTTTNKIYSSADENPDWKDKPQVQQPEEDQGFSCILKNKGNAAKIDSNGESAWFWVDEPNKIAHIFYKKDNKWTQSKNGVEQFVGRWNCDEENHFLIVTDDESYSSRSDNWEKITRVGDSNDSFPLKFGSKGPNVVKLQKFLNNKISANPLTVNGIFDQKTQDKLIEFQKKEGIIE